MAIIRPQVDPHSKIDPQAVKSPSEIADDDALRLVVQDAETAESWMNQHLMSIRWIEADALYQNPPSLKLWEGTTVPRANVSVFTTAINVNSLVAQIVGALFFQDDPFILRPSPALSENLIRAITAVIGRQLDQIKFREECRRGIFNSALFGTGIFKYGWRERIERKTRYKRKPAAKVTSFGKKMYVSRRAADMFEATEEEITVSEPFFNALDIRHVYVDPHCATGDIRDAGYVIHRMVANYRDLCDLAEEQEYDLPSEDEIREWFMPPEASSLPASSRDEQLRPVGSTAYLHHAAPRFQKTTEDPLAEPLEILERWDEDKVIVSLQRAKVIRNSTHRFGRAPFLSVNWWNIPDAFWGMGLGQTTGYEQRTEQGMVNSCLDIMSLALNPTMIRSRGANVTSQNLRQRLGGLMDVDGPVKDALTYIEVPKIPPEAFAVIQQSQARSESSSGANEMLTQGNLPSRGRTSLTRTATGAAALDSATKARAGLFTEDFVRQVFQPFLWELHQMNREMLPLSDLRTILDQKLGSAFELDEEEYLNAPIERFEVLAGSHLAVRQQMQQAISLMVEVFESPQTMQALAQINNEYVDISELLKMISEVSGWRNYRDIVKPMTPQMLQAQQANNPAAAQIEGKMQFQAQQHQNDQDIVDQKSINRIVERGLGHGILENIEAQEQ